MEIIITGASRGIGYYLLKRFLEDGNKVYGNYFRTLPDEAILENYTQLDITNYEDVTKWISKLELKKPVLINCAADNYNSFFHKSDPQKWKELIETNLFGVYNAIHAVLPKMREIEFGRIINLSSVVAKLPTPGVSAYAASKSALWGLTKTLAIENASKGITINNLNLGYINDGMTINAVPEDFRNKLVSKIPVGHFGDVKNIYIAVKALIEMDYMTGASIDINGGMI
jgi:acetoacetyl-CoA reductase/3-oxoacyl-[acyl-carrier protein] reductase